MTAGLDKTIRLFQVTFSLTHCISAKHTLNFLKNKIDGKINSKIQSVHFQDLPIRQASFNPIGTEIIATGRRQYFYIYDVEAGRIDKSLKIHGRRDKSYEEFRISPCGRYIVFGGKDGYLVLVSYQTKQWIANIKMNSSVKGFDWSSDGRYLFGVGGDAEVYQWDVGSRRCVHRFMDFGGFKPTKIAVSRSDGYIAIG